MLCLKSFFQQRIERRNHQSIRHFPKIRISTYFFHWSLLLFYLIIFRDNTRWPTWIELVIALIATINYFALWIFIEYRMRYLFYFKYEGCVVGSRTVKLTKVRNGRLTVRRVYYHDVTGVFCGDNLDPYGGGPDYLRLVDLSAINLPRCRAHGEMINLLSERINAFHNSRAMCEDVP